jgi:hypothetical protein
MEGSIEQRLITRQKIAMEFSSFMGSAPYKYI